MLYFIEVIKSQGEKWVKSIYEADTWVKAEGSCYGYVSTNINDTTVQKFIVSCVNENGEIKFHKAWEREEVTAE